MCYKIRNKNLCAKAVTDIIICSRIIHKDSKLAPVGFSAAGYVAFNTVNNSILCTFNIYVVIDFTLNYHSNNLNICIYQIIMNNRK